MPLSEKAIKHKRETSIQYAKSNYKRIPLDVKLSEYEEIKKASEIAGEPVNTFIKKAIKDRIKDLANKE